MAAKSAARVRTASEPGVVVAFPENLSSHTLPTLSAAHQRAIAISAGDLQVAVKREVVRLVDQFKGDTLSAAKVGLERLRTDELISLPEFNLLSEICEAVFAAQRGKIDLKTAHDRVRCVYDELLLDTGSSPVAIAIASVAAGAYASVSSNDSAPGKMAATRNPNAPDLGMVGGAIIGAGIGGAIGGFVGGGLGAVIGGIVGGVIGKCTQ
jgi:hypothetical protein